MTEKPILFSGEMVRAILDGRKTMTRRVVKPQPTHRLIEGLGHVTIGMNPADDGAVWYDGDCKGPGREVRCPYGRVCDRLWVRETWRETFDIDGTPVMEYRAGGTRLIAGKSIKHGEHRCTSVLPKWRPSIHMPRWASRITLEITGVTVERVQSITLADCADEGAPPTHQDDCVWDSTETFRELWDSINAKRGFGWDTNCWVWVLTFRRIKP